VEVTEIDKHMIATAWKAAIAHFKKFKQLFECHHLVLLRDIWLSKL